MKKKLAAICLSLLAIQAVFVPSANAEVVERGSFNSYLSHVLPGFTSRVWNDDNIGPAQTRIEFKDCFFSADRLLPPAARRSVNSVELELFRENGEFITSNIVDCKTYRDFGRLNGAMFFKIKKVNGSETPGDSLVVNKLAVWY